MSAKDTKPLVDKEYFEMLCMLQYTEEEVLEYVGAKKDAVYLWCRMIYDKNFEEVYQDFKHRGQVQLRARQFELASKSPTMAIHLGKKYLGDEDEDETSQEEESFKW